MRWLRDIGAVLVVAIAAGAGVQLGSELTLRALNRWWPLKDDDDHETGSPPAPAPAGRDIADLQGPYEARTQTQRP